MRQTRGTVSGRKWRGTGSGRALVFLLMILSFIGVSPVARAHATLMHSTPAAGQVMTAAPPAVRLEFSEQIVGEMSSIELIASNGSIIRLRTEVDARNVRVLVGALPNLPAGPYRIVWRIVSADGHPIGDTFVFRIAASEGPGVVPNADEAAFPPMPESRPDAGGETKLATVALPSALRGLAIVSLLGLMGLLVVVRWTGVPRRSRIARVTRMLAIVAPITGALHLVIWAAHVSGEVLPGGSDLSLALGSAVGIPEVVRLALAVLASWALLLARRRVLAAVFCVGAVAVGGAIGHPAAFSPALSVPAKALHLLGASLWLGSLLSIVLTDRADREAFLSQAERASRLAFASVIVVTLSGLLQSALYLNAPADLVESPYGRFVLAKSAGLVALVAFGGYHRTRLMPRLRATADPSELWRSVSRETAVMIAVALIGSVMAYVPTPEVARAGEQTRINQPRLTGVE